jgi:hypothetical protein
MKFIRIRTIDIIALVIFLSVAYYLFQSVGAKGTGPLIDECTGRTLEYIDTHSGELPSQEFFEQNMNRRKVKFHLNSSFSVSELTEKDGKLFDKDGKQCLILKGPGVRTRSVLKLYEDATLKLFHEILSYKKSRPV